MSQSQQEYVKKSLLSEIEESLLKGHGIRNTVQSDFSNKASETSERDYAIPIQCLRKTIEVGVDPSYAIPKWQSGEFANKKEIDRPIRAEAILENQLKFFFSKIEHNDKILLQDDSKKADVRWKDRVLSTKLVTNPFDSILTHLKTSRPSLFRALQHHPMVSGKYIAQSKEESKKSKRERLDSECGNSGKSLRVQKIRKSLLDSDENEDESYEESTPMLNASQQGGEDEDSSTMGVEKAGRHQESEDSSKLVDFDEAGIRSYSMSCVVAKCIADGSLQAQLITLALVMHEYSLGEATSSSPTIDQGPITALPIGNVLATLFENINCSSNFHDDGGDGSCDENRKRLNKAHGLAIRNPFKSCLHLHYSPYQRTSTSTPAENTASSTTTTSGDGCQLKGVSKNLFVEQSGQKETSVKESSDNNECHSADSDDEEDDDEAGDDDDSGEDEEEDDDEMLAAALAMSMGGEVSVEEFVVQGEPESDESSITTESNLNDKPHAVEGSVPETVANQHSCSIPLLSEVNPLSTFGPFCEIEFWKSIQSQQSCDNDVSLLSLQHVMTALLVNIGAGVDKAMLSKSEGSENKKSKLPEKGKGVPTDSLSSLVSSITASLTGGDQKVDTGAVPELKTGLSSAAVTSADPSAADTLPIMATTPIIPHPISFLLIEVLLDMVVSLLAGMEKDGNFTQQRSKKYFLAWSMTVLLKLLNCNFSLLSDFKIPPSTIGLVDPLADNGGDLGNSVTSRLMTVVLKCMGTNVSLGANTATYPQYTDIEAAILRDDKAEKELSLHHIHHSGVAYMYAIKILSANVFASGFNIFYPSIPDRFNVVRRLLRNSPVNTGLAVSNNNEFSPFKFDEVDEFSAYFNYCDNRTLPYGNTSDRYCRDAWFYDSLLLQKLCLSLASCDDASKSLLALGFCSPVSSNSQVDTPSPDPLDMLVGVHDNEETLQLDDIGGDDSAALIYRDVERLLFNRLRCPNLLGPLVAQDGALTSGEVMMRSGDDYYRSSTGIDTSASVNSDQQIGCIHPSKSLIFGEMCLYRLITQSYAAVLTRNLGTGEDSMGTLLHFESGRCNKNLTIGDEGSCVSQTKSKTWSSVLASEGFEPESGEHSWIVRVDRSDRGHVFIGIGTSRCSLETYVGGDDQSWGLIGTKALWHNRSKIKTSYGDGFTTGSSIHVKYDSDNGRVYFSDDSGTSWGLAFDDIPSTTIYPAISLYQREDKVVISNYTQSSSGISDLNNCKPVIFSDSVVAINKNPFATMVPFVVFSLSLLDSIEDILISAEATFVGDTAESLNGKVAILSHPFISLLLPILSCNIVVNKLPHEQSSYLSVHLLPHLTLLTKRLSSIQESLEKESDFKNSKLLQNFVQKDYGLIGNISGLWRINSTAGGVSIPAQEYYLQLFSSPFKGSPLACRAHDDDNVDTANESMGKYLPVELSGSGQGQSANVSISGTMFGTRIRFCEQWHLGGTCLIDARISLDGSSFFGTFKDVKSGVVGALTASRVYNSTVVSKLLSEDEKYAMKLRQTSTSNTLLKTSLVAGMACGRLSANMIISMKVRLPDINESCACSADNSEDETGMKLAPSDELIDNNGDSKVDDDDGRVLGVEVKSGDFDLINARNAKLKQSAALINRWLKSDLFSEGLEINAVFLNFVGTQWQSYFTIDDESLEYPLTPKAIELKSWWLRHAFIGLSDYCMLDPESSSGCFRYSANPLVPNNTDDGFPKPASVPDSPDHGLYQQLQHNLGDGKCLDEYVMSHVGLSSLCKIGGESIQAARRHVLAALIYHSGYLEVCTAEILTLHEANRIDCKPNLILLEIWRAGQKVIEHYVRQKQLSGVTYSLVSQEICKKSDFLMSVIPSRSCKDVTRNLQSTMSSEFAKKRSFDYHYGAPVNPLLEKTYDAKNLSETVAFFQTDLEVDALKSALQRVSLKTLFRAAGLRSVALLLGKGISTSSLGSTMLPSRLPPLSTLVVQSAVVEYVLPSMYGICDFTTDLNLKWMAEMSLTSSPLSPLSPKDPTDNDDGSQVKNRKIHEKETNLKGHFGDSLQGACVKFLCELRQSFETLFELITQLLHRCTWAGDRDGQCVSLSAWDITIIPEDHAFLNRIGIFRVLQTVLDDTRSFLVSNTETALNATDDDKQSGVYAREMAVSASKRLTQLALKIVHTLASQIAFCKDESEQCAIDNHVPPQLIRQASGPETLSQALFDMLYTEFFSCLKQIIAVAHGAPLQPTSKLRDDEFEVALGSSSSQFEEIDGEKYAYRILRLLFSVSSSAVCRRYLCSPKWLTLLLAGVGAGGLGVQRRLLRLLRKLITSLTPTELRAYNTEFFSKNDEVVLSERALDDEDVECLMSVHDDNGNSFEEIAPGTRCADRIVQYFLKASTAHIAPLGCEEPNDEQNAFMLNLYSVPSGTNSLSAECIALLRTLEEVPSWKTVLRASLRQPLRHVLSVDPTPSSWEDPLLLRAIAATMGVLGGYVDRVRVGGTVTLKPFSLVGLSETFALRLAAVSHSCGMVVAKSEKSLELVLVERSRKYLKSEYGDDKDKAKYSAHYVMSLAGGTPVRSVKMAPEDVIPAPDVFSPVDFFDEELFNDCVQFLGKTCIPFIESCLKKHPGRRVAKTSVSKKRAESIESQWRDVEGDEEFDNDDIEDDCDDGEDEYERSKSHFQRKHIQECTEEPDRTSDNEKDDEESLDISDVEALQLYVSAVSFRATSTLMQKPLSFDACTASSLDIIRKILGFAVKPLHLGGLGELEALEERWASVWEALSLLKYKDKKEHSPQVPPNQNSPLFSTSLADNSSSMSVSVDSTSRSSENRGARRDGGGRGGPSGRGAGSSGNGNNLSSGMLASMLSTPSSADAARARGQMMDMGFPKEWCDVALRRCRYNVELAINLCFEHGSEMNQLVAEEAALQAARSSTGGSSGSNSTSGGIRQASAQSGTQSILERLANRGRSSDETSSRPPTSSRSSNSTSMAGIGLARRRHLLSMGFPKSWCNRALEAAENDVDASIAWIISHGEELIAAEESADKTESPAPGRSIEELLSAIGRSDEKGDEDECDKDRDDDDDDDDDDDGVETDEHKENTSKILFADSPVVDCKNVLSSICGSAIVNHNTLACGGSSSSGFPTIGCRGYAVSSGKWYYEVALDTAGCIQVGWVDVAFTGNADAGEGVGDDAHSWAYDGWRLLKWNGSSAEWGAKWTKGDVIGCAVDMDNCTMSFFLNGYAEEINMGVAFEGFSYLGGLFPCLSYNRNEKCTFAFNGRDFKHAPPAGYRPFAEHIQTKLNKNAILVNRYLSSHSLKSSEADETEHGSADSYYFEDCLEEQRGENDFLPHKRYFQPDESRSGNNQLERQCQQLSTKIVSARMPTSRDGLLDEFVQLSGELSVLYARMAILRILSSYNRQLNDDGDIDDSIMSDRSTKYFNLFFQNQADVDCVMQLLKESCISSLRTKVYLQTMSILSTSTLPPPNLGSVLTVGGFPVLNSVVDVMSSMLVTASSGTGGNDNLLKSILHCISNELLNSCRREFSADWVVENGGTPVIYKDVLMLSKDIVEPNAVQGYIPSLSLAVYLSSMLMQHLFVKRMKCGKMSTSDDEIFCLQWVEPLILSWAEALKSPVIAVKMCASRHLAYIIQQFFFIDEPTSDYIALPDSFFSKVKVILASCVSLERIEKVVLQRMEEEKGSYPICSEYLQSLLEFSVTLRTVLETVVGDSDSEPNYVEQLTRSDSLHSFPSSKGEIDDGVSDFNWDAISGNMLSDDGWDIWTGSVKQLETSFTTPDTQSGVMSFASRHHESVPPALLPGCKVMRRSFVNIEKKPTVQNDEVNQNIVKGEIVLTGDEMEVDEDGNPDMQDRAPNVEETESSNENCGLFGDSSNASRQSSIAELQAASDRMRGSIAKLLSERGKRILEDRDRKLSEEGGGSSDSKEVVQIGTVIGVCAWPGCAPGTARVIKWVKDKSTKLEPPSHRIETVRWGAEGVYDVHHVVLDQSTKKKNKIQTQYPPPISIEEQAAKNGFARELSFGVIFRLRSAPLQDGDAGADIEARCDGVMEWPDFKAVVYVTGVMYSYGDWVITEKKLVSGSHHTDWWARFGTSSWRAGTTYTMSLPTHSAAEYARVSSEKQMLGLFSYTVDNFAGQSIEVTGDITIQQSQLFTFDNVYHAQSVQISHDRLAAACTGGEGKCIAFANVGFSTGVHYWEYKVEQCDLGNIYVGVAEKSMMPGQPSMRLNKWYGHGFVNMRTSYRHTQGVSGERVYGDIFQTGDTVGVLLDMNRGALSFFLDGMKYGEHLLTDLGVAFDGLNSGNAKNVQKKTLFPVIGFRRSGDRVTITPRWISTMGNVNTCNDLNTINRAWSLLTHWGSTRPSMQPRERDVWTYREAWRDWLRWRSDRYLKVRTRCRGVSLNLTASLDKSPRACVDASIRLGLSVALFHGDRIVFNSSCGRKLEAKEDAVVLGALRGQLWYRLDSQREGDRGAMLEGSNAHLAWCLAPYDMEDIELVRRGSVVKILPSNVLSLNLARIPVYHGCLLRVVYEQGAVMRAGLEIDAADVVGTLAHDAIVFAVERRVNSSNIARYRVFYEGIFGWISEKIRGGHEEYMVSRVSMDAESIAQYEQVRKEAVSAADGNADMLTKIELVQVKTPEEAMNHWTESVLKSMKDDISITTQVLGTDVEAMLSPGGILSEEFRRESSESFEEYLNLATTMDNLVNWSVECDMLLAEFISHTASKEGQSPYNLSCDQILMSLASLNEKSPLKTLDPKRIIARTSIIRVANSLISSAIPYFQMVLPEEKWGADCFGSKEADIGMISKEVQLSTPLTKLSTVSESGGGCVSDAGHLMRMDRDMNYLGDNFNQWAINKSSHVWAPPCGARRMHVMRRVLFTQTKKLFWDNILESTTTATPLNQDEYEDPREIKDIRINRVKATQSKLASIGNMAERIRQSVFGQLHREMRQWPASSFRRSYLGKGHGGQYRAFKVKFMGEGVNDYGGPYRAVFEQVVDELQCDSNNVGSKSSDRCLLPLLVPCPNRSTVVGPNQDKFLFASSTSPLIQELMQFFGKLSGTALRHNLNMSLNLSLLLWRPMVRLPVSLRQLETIDTLTVKHLSNIEKLALELEVDSSALARGVDYIPDEWMDTFFTATFADGTKVSLVPGGEDIPLTLGNWRVYIALVERHRLRESSVLYKAYRNGLSSVLPVELFSLFTANEIDELFSGNNVVDVNLLRQCTEYEGISSDSELAKNFWSVLEEMSDDERTSFLRFVWARSRMPASAQDLPMNFKLQADNSGSAETVDEYLPHAQTCFFSLSLPNYSSKEILRTKLLYAINNSPNMDADVRLHNADGWADV